VAGPGRPGRQPGATSRAYEHACRVYRELAARSVPAADGARLFHGNLLTLLRELGYTSRAQYADIKTALVRMGCVQQVARGSRHKVGAWLLLRPPDEGLWRQYVGPFRSRELADQRDHHDRLLVRFFVQAPTLHRELLVTLVAAGVRTVDEVIAWLGALPEKRLRAMFPAGEVCVALHHPGAPHTCRVAGLDETVPSHAAGARKRRADKLAELAEAESD
jgi:hypothetical protein